MKIFQQANQMLPYILEQKKNGKKIGFVPTMGALHKGHLSLIEASQKENDLTVCSIFVNPTQFNNPEDLEKYPRNDKEDIEKLEAIGCDILYLPTAEDVYPGGMHSSEFDFGGIENQMEGECRPGHFNGVATVVNRLFRVTSPDAAYFGEKDYQQLAIVRKLMEIENFGFKLVGIPTFREKDGLAMSSRNVRLSPEFRAEAPKIYQFLLKAKDLCQNQDFKTVQKTIQEDFSKTELQLEYFKICDQNTLVEATSREEGKNYRAFVAVFAGKIRLIDNLQIC
ncbi:MAG: pantoate--beta-alanine ligase [Flavobacteriaceae bacterium]|nr:MAG: pantoate--beta-alanine ligase [Flavobacteriaceae bacterium]